MVKCFEQALGVPIDQISDSLSYNSIKQWDSVAHMSLVAALETEFDIMLDTDDILAMSSVAVARQILQKNGVVFE
jgi:acyl carrier protein